jgi:hypothetical protein
VPLSYFVPDSKSGCPHPAHLNTPLRFSRFSGLAPRGSVP